VAQGERALADSQQLLVEERAVSAALMGQVALAKAANLQEAAMLDDCAALFSQIDASYALLHSNVRLLAEPRPAASWRRTPARAAASAPPPPRLRRASRGAAHGGGGEQADVRVQQRVARVDLAEERSAVVQHCGLLGGALPVGSLRERHLPHQRRAHRALLHQQLLAVRQRPLPLRHLAQSGLKAASRPTLTMRWRAPSQIHICVRQPAGQVRVARAALGQARRRLRWLRGA